MTHPIVAVQCEFLDDGTVLTTLGQSPRGTRFQIREIQVDVPRDDPEAFQKAVKEAIGSV